MVPQIPMLGSPHAKLANECVIPGARSCSAVVIDGPSLPAWDRRRNPTFLQNRVLPCQTAPVIGQFSAEISVCIVHP